MTHLCFNKTRAGVAEVDDRHSPLPQKLRALLGTITTRSKAETLLNQAKSLGLDASAIRELVRRGLLEPMFDETGPAHEPANANACDELRCLDIARAYATAYMRDFAGDAGDAFRTLFAMVDTEADLLLLLNNCIQVIIAVEGAECAARFTRHVRQLVSQAESADVI
ncbi:MAG TPA: hypothetical protein VFS42_06090 [Burkholderiaceae bacterium]|nr:hypothetical protein [Burkholderiaceae bacterium]